MNWTDKVTIDAPVDLVWRLNTDLADWPAYNPTMQSVERLDDGPLRVGSQARIKQRAQRPAVWTVIQLEPGREFRWQTARRGLTLTGTHLVTAEGHGCRNTLRVEASGALARPFWLLIGPAVRRALRVENAGFKARAELPASSASPA